MKATAPITSLRGKAAATGSSIPIPFCTRMIAVSGPTASLMISTGSTPGKTLRATRM